MKTVTIASMTQESFSRIEIFACVWWFFQRIRENSKAFATKHSGFFTSVSSQLLPLTMLRAVRRFLYGAAFTRGFQLLTIKQTDLHSITLCLVPSNCSSCRKGYFLFWNRMNADKESHGIATEGFVYIKREQAAVEQPWARGKNTFSHSTALQAVAGRGCWAQPGAQPQSRSAGTG